MGHNRLTHRDGIDSHMRDFPGGPVVKTSPSNAGHVGSISGWGIKISHASWPKNQNIKQRQYCSKFNKDFKVAHIKKKILIFASCQEKGPPSPFGGFPFSTRGWNRVRVFKV